MPVEILPEIGNPIMVTPGQNSAQAALFTQNALLAGISAEIFDQVSSQIQALSFEPDEMVFAENDPGDSLYLIAQGSIKISKRGRGGQQETLAYLNAGDYFGEMALVDGGTRSAQASAVGKTILGRIDRSTWDLLLKLAPQAILTNFTRSVTQRLRQNNQHFIEQMMRSERLSLIGTTISSIVHDMNNPISTILGGCKIILSHTNDELINQMAQFILDSVEGMQTMTREIVDFSRGKTQLKLNPVSVPELVRQLEPEFAKCRLGAEVRVEVGFAGSLQIDRHRLLRVFGNLIKNARDAMKAGNANLLSFSVREISSQVEFEVSDTGHGISNDLLPKIFEPFVTEGKAHGTGLGLAISKAVVDAHGGTIAVASSETGTTFTVRLPLPPKEEA